MKMEWERMCRRVEGYADEVQAQDGQMKSIRKKDNIGQVLPRLHFSQRLTKESAAGGGGGG